MSAGSFQRNSVDWQFFQWLRRLGEWWEFQVSQWSVDFPELDQWAWLDSQLAEQIFKALSFFVIVLLLLWLALRFSRVVRPGLKRWIKQWESQSLRLRESEPVPSSADWLKRSHQYQRQGDVYQACRCLYLGMLDILHEQGIVPHQASRTDGEYLQSLSLLPQPDPCRQLFEIHQHLCFGGLVPSQGVLSACQQAFRQLTSPPH